MPPVRSSRGRAPKACHACRATKTRCYPTDQESLTCLRCETLGKECSLQREALRRDTPHSLQPGVPETHDCKRLEQRVLSLEVTVQRLENMLARTPQNVVSESSSAAHGAGHNHAAAPMQVIHDAILDPSRSWQEQNPFSEANIVQKRIVSADEADRLLALFQRHYGRWLSIPETVITMQRSADVKDALFLCVSCLVAAKHSTTDNHVGLPGALFAEARYLLGISVLQPRRPLAFFQASLVLSLWSSAVGQRTTSMDAWLITAMALQQGLISDVFKEIATGDMHEINNQSEADSLHLWNHLCLSHLHACITMRRKAMINTAHVRQARLVTRIKQHSNFESRMAAELCLYWAVYEELELAELDLERARATLRAWRSDWNILFLQERHHFLQMGISFAQLLILERALTNSSKAVDRASVAEMLEFCSDILQAAIRTPDERTEHLTHHIYHIITFAALTLSRLLNRHEQSLFSPSETVSWHALVVETSQWLRSIGRPDHIGRILGNIVATLYQSLFPAQELDLADDFRDAHNVDNLYGMPEFFDLDGAFDWDSLQ